MRGKTKRNGRNYLNRIEYCEMPSAKEDIYRKIPSIHTAKQNWFENFLYNCGLHGE